MNNHDLPITPIYARYVTKCEQALSKDIFEGLEFMQLPIQVRQRFLTLTTKWFKNRNTQSQGQHTGQQSLNSKPPFKSHYTK